jgi:hypothetical protein
MNNIKDFKKKENNIIINTNTKDYLRAKKRNYIHKQQELYFGNHDNDIGILPKIVNDLNNNQYNVEKDKHNITKMKQEVYRLKKEIKEMKDILDKIGGNV